MHRLSGRAVAVLPTRRETAVSCAAPATAGPSSRPADGHADGETCASRLPCVLEALEPLLNSGARSAHRQRQEVGPAAWLGRVGYRLAARQAGA